MAGDAGVDLRDFSRALNLADPSNERRVYTRLHEAVLSNDADEITRLLSDGADANEKTYAKNAEPSSEIQCECTNLMFCFHQADEYGNERKDGNIVEQNALHLGAKHSDVEVVKLLLGAIRDVNEPSGDGSTALHYAIQNSDIEVVRLLLESGADIDSQNNDGKSPLYLAVKFERIDMVKYLLFKGANVNVRTRNQSTPLFSALVNCNEELVQILLDNKASIDVKNKYGEEPLFFVLRVVDKGEPRLHFVRLLLDNGVNLDNCNRHGSTPLHIAVQSQDKELATLLIDQGCRIDSKDCFDMSPLSLAVCTNKVNLARLLLTRGANVNDSVNRSSILEHAVMRRNAELVQLLLEFNADINAGSENNPPVFAASQHRHTNIMQMLIDKGADINRKDKNGRTPLMRSIKVTNYAMMRLLIDQGASINQQDNDGNTAFHVLFENSYTDEGWSEYLLEIGADFNIENKSGHTPFACMMFTSFTKRQVLLFIRYIVLHLARGRYVNPKITHYLMASPTWSKEFNVYLKELEQMKKTKILEKYTFFDVLSQKCTFLTPVLKEKNIVHFEMGLLKNQFCYYKEMIRKVFYKKAERLTSLKNCRYLLNSIFQTKLLPEIIERICDFLSNEEMQALTISFIREKL